MDTPSWFELPHVTCLPLNVNDVENLRNLFEHPGWKTFERVLKAEARKSADDAVNLSLDEKRRICAAAAFHAHAWTVQLPYSLEYGMKGQEPVEKKDLTLDTKTLLDLVCDLS